MRPAWGKHRRLKGSAALRKREKLVAEGPRADNKKTKSKCRRLPIWSNIPAHRPKIEGKREQADGMAEKGQKGGDY